MSQSNFRRSQSKMRKSLRDSLSRSEGEPVNRAQRRFQQNQKEECVECGKLIKSKNMVRHLEEFHYATEEG